MGLTKCCVGGCDATSDTHRVFCFPKTDWLRSLWMSFVVPTNSLLIGLPKDQLITKRVCQKHFDKTQFDEEGKRLRFAYPCLFTDEEMARGEPLLAPGVVHDVLKEHSYFKEQDDDEDLTGAVMVIGKPGGDFQEHPSCSNSEATQIDKRDGTINIAGQDLSVFFDPPHLLKGLRINFVTKTIIWKGRTATWKDIQFIYDLDSQLGHTRALPKLTAHHVNPDKMKKMKVSVAAQVFSSRTAAMLKYTNALNKFHTEPIESMETTAEVVEFVDKLFDSVNCYPGGATRGKLRKAIKKDSPHHTFWAEAIQILKSMKFEDSKSKIALKHGKRLVRVPSLDGWIITLESFIRISKILFQKYSVDYYYPRYINQDPLENFFGRLRALNYRNVNPDANSFIYSYKSLMLSNFLSPQSKFSNCEVDSGETLVDFHILFEEKTYKNKGNLMQEKNCENKENKHPPQSTSQQFQRPPISGSVTNFSADQAVLEKISPVFCIYSRIHMS